MLKLCHCVPRQGLFALSANDVHSRRIVANMGGCLRSHKNRHIAFPDCVLLSVFRFVCLYVSCSYLRPFRALSVEYLDCHIIGKHVSISSRDNARHGLTDCCRRMRTMCLESLGGTDENVSLFSPMKNKVGQRMSQGGKNKALRRIAL